MKKLLLVISAFLIFNSSFAQPIIQWQKCLGGTSTDLAYSIQQTADGGFVVVGRTDSNDGDVSGNHGVHDYWIVKLNSSGNLQWQKSLGGTMYDYGESIQQTIDGGFIVAGYTDSNDGDVTGNHGYEDFWVVKLDGSGNLQWQKCLGGSSSDDAHSICQTNDGGYIVAGRTGSNDGDVTGNHGGPGDIWVVKLDGSGNLLWQKCLGGTYSEIALSIQQTNDGGTIIAGQTSSNNGDVSGNHDTVSYYNDIWIVKLDNLGILQWQKCFGGTFVDQVSSVRQTADEGFVVAGYTRSNDGDVMGNHGNNDYWIVKLDSSGTLQWQKCLGGAMQDYARSVQQTSDGGFIVVGYTDSNDGDVTGNHGINDYWVVKLGGSGNLQWQKCLGGTDNDVACCIQQTTDGGFVVGGHTLSMDGDVTGNHGAYDYWIVKLASYVGIEEETGGSFLNISPNPITTQATITFNKEVQNATFSLYNLLGEKAAETKGIHGDSFLFSRGNLPSGVYVFEVREEGNKIYRGKALVY